MPFEPAFARGAPVRIQHPLFGTVVAQVINYRGGLVVLGSYYQGRLVEACWLEPVPESSCTTGPDVVAAAVALRMLCAG